MTDSCKVLATWNGYCADCERDRPLVLVERGCFGLAAWLRGLGSEDRTLRYTCRVCGRVEYVPATEAEDARYDASLPRWADLDLVAEIAALREAAAAVAALAGGSGDPLAGRPAEPARRVWEDPHLVASAELSALVMFDVPRPAHLHINPDTPVTGTPVETAAGAVRPTLPPSLPAAPPTEAVFASAPDVPGAQAAALPSVPEPREPSPVPHVSAVRVVSAPAATPLQPTDLVLFGLAA